MNEGQTSQEDHYQRAILLADLRRTYDQSLDARVDRYLEVNPQYVIGNHYFAAASSECISLYRDGHFISTVMVSQTVNEGILKFVGERNGIPRCNHEEMIKHLKGKTILSEECLAASTGIWGTFRNDVHHMNPGIANVPVPFPILAKTNIQRLALIEKEIFAVEWVGGKLKPKQRKYWDVRDDGTVPVFLRMEA